jgi:putative ABC transport system substrate-binding protein
LWSALVLTGFVAAETRAEPSDIAVLSTGSGGVYADVLAGFRSHLEEAMPAARLDVHTISEDDMQRETLLAQLRAEPPSLLLTLGSTADALAAEQFPQIPRVVGLVTGERLRNASGNVTGVDLDFPVKVELEWLRRFFPGKQAVGVLFDPANNREKIAAAKTLAKKLGINLVSREVSSPRALPEALKSASKSIDVLWGVTDPIVLSPATAKSILVFSYRNRIPFAGLSDSWTNAGALYSLDRDYVDIGRQCAEIAVRIERGARADSLPVKHPRTVLYSVNLKAARHMNLKISETLIANARHVVR